MNLVLSSIREANAEDLLGHLAQIMRAHFRPRKTQTSEGFAVKLQHCLGARAGVRARRVFRLKNAIGDGW
jgi:hypothetical protein